jgi:hypothetical protein
MLADPGSERVGITANFRGDGLESGVFRFGVTEKQFNDELIVTY